ncbi:UAA-domain-containing protein [Meredithblackwellia eburnea MCA 4105]
MTLSFALHGALLVVVFSLYGVLQEKVIKTSYGDDVEHFQSTSLLILCNRLFAMLVAVAILVWKGRKASTPLLQAIRPTSPIHQFALVAAYNFLATTCQYQALSHVSFTTASLAKTTKMIPVIIVGRLVYNKRATMREWISAAVIALGCATYLSTSTGGPSPLDDDNTFTETFLGTFFLAGYLFFDGLTSSTQETYFGRSTTSTDPFGPESNILQQMIYTNIFSSFYSLGGIGFDIAAGTFFPSLRLLLTSFALQRDVFLLSATAAGGLIILLNTIASFGALSSALLMTVRQFVSIVLNAGIFRHFLSVGLQGWCGVGWVASGIWIKTNSSNDIQLPRSDSFSQLDEEALLSNEKDDSTSSRSSSPVGTPRDYIPRPSTSQSTLWYYKNYFVPIVAPLLGSAFLLFIFPEFGAKIVRAEMNEDLVQYAAHTFREKPASGEFVAVEGGRWEKELVDATWPECNVTETEVWPGTVRTALSSFPRSGNTFTRELVERATNWQTSTVGYCDHSLRPTFHGECDVEAKFLVKTHYPEYIHEHDFRYLDQQNFDQVVHLVRNPIDALISSWQLAHVPKDANGQLDHSGRLEVDSIGANIAERADIMTRARKYLNHYLFWRDVSTPKHLVRYEDLMNTRLPTLMSLLAFLLPSDDELPSLSQIACALELDESREAYKSRKAPEFAAWSTWDPELRKEVLTLLKEPWCEFGYDHLLRKSFGTDTGVDDLCD